ALQPPNVARRDVCPPAQLRLRHAPRLTRLPQPGCVRPLGDGGKPARAVSRGRGADLTHAQSPGCLPCALRRPGEGVALQYAKVATSRYGLAFAFFSSSPSSL